MQQKYKKLSAPLPTYEKRSGEKYKQAIENVCSAENKEQNEKERKKCVEKKTVAMKWRWYAKPAIDIDFGM